MNDLRTRRCKFVRSIDDEIGLAGSNLDLVDHDLSSDPANSVSSSFISFVVSSRLIPCRNSNTHTQKLQKSIL